MGTGLAAMAQATALHLGADVAGREASPRWVLAGQNAPMVLTLIASSAVEPALSGDLFATAGGLAAPLFSQQPLPVHRIGPPAPGVQRYDFSVEIPPAEKRQSLLLRLRVRSDPAGAWLPLPPLILEARPSTWRTALRQFAGRHACGRLAGSARLEALFTQAGVAVEEIAGEGPATRVGFAEAGEDKLELPESPATLWLVFKPGAGTALAPVRPTPDGPLALVIDARVLAALETDAAAQDVFERALAAATVLVDSPGLPSTTP